MIPEVFGKAADFAIITGAANLPPREPWRWDFGGWLLTLNRSDAPIREPGTEIEIPPFTLLVMWPDKTPAGLVDGAGGSLACDEDDLIFALDRALYMRREENAAAVATAPTPP